MFYYLIKHLYKYIVKLYKFYCEITVGSHAAIKNNPQRTRMPFLQFPLMVTAYWTIVQNHDIETIKMHNRFIYMSPSVSIVTLSSLYLYPLLDCRPPLIGPTFEWSWPFKDVIQMELYVCLAIDLLKEICFVVFFFFSSFWVWRRKLL